MSELLGAIFDLDGVLVSTDEYHYRAWKQLADRENIYFDRKINDRLRGVSRMASLEVILERASRTYTDAEKASMAEQKNNAYREMLRELTPGDVLPGVLPVLKELRARGVKLAVGSSSKNAPVILEQTDLARFFDAVADGSQIVNTKPDPEVFLLAAKLLGLRPEQCFVVEDAVPGIKAAAAAGSKPVAVGPAQGCEGARYSLPSLECVNVDALLAE